MAISKSSLLAFPLESLRAHWATVEGEVATLTTAQTELARLLGDDAADVSNSAQLGLSVTGALSRYSEEVVDILISMAMTMVTCLTEFLPGFEELTADEDTQTITTLVVERVGNIACPPMCHKMQIFQQVLDGCPTSKWPRSSASGLKHAAYDEACVAYKAATARLKTYMGVATAAACLFVTIPGLPPGQSDQAAVLKSDVLAKLKKQDRFAM